MSGSTASSPEPTTASFETTGSLTEPTGSSTEPTGLSTEPTGSSTEPIGSSTEPTNPPSVPTITPSAPTIMPSVPTITWSVPSLTPSTPTITWSAPTITWSIPTITPSVPEITWSVSNTIETLSYTTSEPTKTFEIDLQPPTAMAETAVEPSTIAFYSKSRFNDPWTPTLRKFLAIPDLNLRAYIDGGLSRNTNFIKMIFPLPEESCKPNDGPFLDAQVRSAFSSSIALQNSLFTAFQRMARFYGFTVQVEPTPERGVKMYKRSFLYVDEGRTWWHNLPSQHRIITRIIHCIRILGLEDTAKAFHNILRETVGADFDPIAVDYWRQAAGGLSWVPPGQDASIVLK